MTVKFLAGMLKKDTVVIIKDRETKAVIWKGAAGKAEYEDTVKDWDFSRDHIIYV